MPSRYDVVIIGAGVAGCATAAHLGQIDGTASLLLLEARNAGAGSTSRSMAAFRQEWTIPAHVAFSRASLDEYRELERTGHPLALRERGYLFLFEDEARLAHAAARVRAAGAASATVVAAADLAGYGDWGAELDTASIAGALWGAEDGFLDPLALAEAYRSKALAAGVSYRSGAEVGEILRDRGRAAGVRLAAGERIAAAAVANCAGAWSAALAARSGLPLPLAPVKRYLYHSRPLRGRDPSRWPLIVAPGGAHLRPAEGRTLSFAWERLPRPAAGAPPPAAAELWSAQDRIERGFGLGTGEYGVEVLAALAERIPILAQEVALAHVTSGWYTTTPDHKAILAEDPRLGGLFHGTGFSGHGIMHAAATGRSLAELITGRTPTIIARSELEEHFGLAALLDGRSRGPLEELVL